MKIIITMLTLLVVMSVAVVANGEILLDGGSSVSGSITNANGSRDIASTYALTDSETSSAVSLAIGETFNIDFTIQTLAVDPTADGAKIGYGGTGWALNDSLKLGFGDGVQALALQFDLKDFNPKVEFGGDDAATSAGNFKLDGNLDKSGELTSAGLTNADKLKFAGDTAAFNLTVAHTAANTFDMTLTWGAFTTNYVYTSTADMTSVSDFYVRINDLDVNLGYEITVIPPPKYPLYPRVNNLLMNDTSYDLTQETYQFEELWSVPRSSSTNMLDYMGKTPIVSRGTNTFIVYVDDDFRPVVTQIHADGTHESGYIDNMVYQPSEFYSNSGVARYYSALHNDNHHNFSIGMDKQGYLHIVGDMHNYPKQSMEHLPLRYYDNQIMYWRSDNPYDISSFSYYGDQALKCPQGSGFTYYTFFNDWNGELFMGSRAMQASSKRCIAMSRYDAQTGNWSVVGGTVPGEPNHPRFFYEDASRIPGDYSKTSLAGQFDRNNNMHCSAPTVGYDIVYPVIPDAIYNFHHTTHILYARSDDGGTSFVKADGSTPIVMPARVVPSANQADFVYAVNVTNSTPEYISTGVSLATDYREIPFVEMQQIFTNSNPDITYIMEWDQTQNSWIKHPNPSTRGAADFILQADPAGVLNWFNDDSSEMHRFWHPASTPVTITLPWSFKKMDAEYAKQTGNILGVAATTTDIYISKVIIGRPGLDLIVPTAETPTNHPPEITTAAAFNGTTLAVTASDADGDPLTYTWSKSYGPGAVLFSANGTEASSNTTLSVSAEGSYEIKVAISDGHSMRISTCTAYLYVSPDSPVVITEAGASPDTVTLQGTSTLSVTATNAAGGTATYTWSKVSGPGDVSFSVNGTAASSNTVASFSALGTYELQVSIINNAGIALSFCTVTAFAGDISSDDFQSNDWVGGTGWDGGWTVTAGGDTPPDIVELSGNYAVRLREGKNNQSITRTLANGIANGTLTFTWDVDTLNSDTEFGYAEIYDGSWHTVWSMNDSGNGVDADNSPDNLQRASVDLSAYGTVTEIRFRTSDNTGSWDMLFIDDVTIASKPYTFWAEYNNLYGQAAAYSADPDGDGINNLGEYALGGNPNTNDVADIMPIYSISEAGGTNWFNYIYKRRRDADVRNLTYEVQTATNLTSNAWTNNAEKAGSAIIDTDYESVTNRISSDGKDQAFMRLKLEINE
ncbi:BNR-4 repeat-containing protein [Pontiellaceae bacterium B12227]|nr:BNR-4 repeat-containing protein [Pontiellaceae bacterium B12227]